MFDIDKLDNIKLTRGDSMTLQVALYRDGELYEPDPLDVISFTVRKEYTDETAAIAKNLVAGELSLAPADTASLDIGVYHYDMKITFADGSVDTFLAEKTFEVGPNA